MILPSSLGNIILGTTYVNIILKYCTYVPLFASPVGKYVGVFLYMIMPTSLVDHSGHWLHLENVGVLLYDAGLFAISS